jgi:hypothetical protein
MAASKSRSRKTDEGPTAEEKIVVSLIELMEAGSAPWRRPRDGSGDGYHVNLISGQPPSRRQRRRWCGCTRGTRSSTCSSAIRSSWKFCGDGVLSVRRHSSWRATKGAGVEETSALVWDRCSSPTPDGLLERQKNEMPLGHQGLEVLCNPIHLPGR